MKYTVVTEKGAFTYGAFVPDLPGCIAAGETREETLCLIKEAIAFHIGDLLRERQEIPRPCCDLMQVEENV
uniref:Predicted nuclease of the RNAse H fold, HicB family n=1 Tax=Candidatus Kentrum sp. UNK TaxID=2126344 RepID=A0A451A4B7_9GAMM|nr:MAG: Predicted nuclease of the RNAse H fold, HicB family [Candidatus Kentron sp. UNK]VFK69547.1 MAG: Predicted nuclease of the RNAse H fold, HicB family [Candidatus Kentron sp. UNK]